MTEISEDYSTVAFSKKGSEKGRKSSRQPEFRRPEKKKGGISRRNLHHFVLQRLSRVG